MINSKKSLLVFSAMVLTLAISGESSADDSDWRIYSEEANGDVYFFDTSRVKQESDLHTVWQRIRYKRSVMGASSYQSLLEVDCSEQSVKILQRTFFSDRQWKQPAMSTDMKEKPKRPIKDGSAAARLSQILCAQ